MEESRSSDRPANGLGQLTDAEGPTEREREQLAQARFGVRLRRVCENRNITQTQLAQKIGVNVARVGHWWRGENGVSLYWLIVLADALDTSADVLIGRGPVSARLADQEEMLAMLHKVLQEHPGRIEVNFYGAPIDHRRVVSFLDPARPLEEEDDKISRQI